MSLGRDGAEIEIPALSLQGTQGQGRGTRSEILRRKVGQPREPSAPGVR
jgi:hypothetical protein